MVLVRDHVLSLTKDLLPKRIHVFCEVFETVIIVNRDHDDDRGITFIYAGGAYCAKLYTGDGMGLCSYELYACLIGAQYPRYNL